MEAGLVYPEIKRGNRIFRLQNPDLDWKNEWFR